jgi:hypothetical protein
LRSTAKPPCRSLPAEITFPSEQVESLKGEVSEIGTVAGDANAFPVKVTLAEPSDKVLPGMTAEVALILGESSGSASYLVPLSAIAAGNEPKQAFVFVFNPETSTVKMTAIGGKGVEGNRVMITEGIAPGDVIAVAGVSFLRDGQEVKLMSEQAQAGRSPMTMKSRKLNEWPGESIPMPSREGAKECLFRVRSGRKSGPSFASAVEG